ncbi:hypothetical protein C8J46_1065 [Sphingomonas sp. PP-F2F-A104-K0414]|uniref:hypothetical protein n=1 Tax=Sphingomonas sp. PP-F2F-A104-K0414 TaxID=2135661 RepID=UPI00104A6E8D|nr:hypothetical protein [Sphingomonas sp. PP-F2F-A104-K0414]TCP97383.1 hypothetical protein C8J46_1065 [Sphingomonas sp. PP-F2F-A104-K0414]
MARKPKHNTLWLAQRHGQDWRDDDVLTAVAWLQSLVPSAEWAPRLAAVEERFQAAKLEWAEGRRAALFDPADAIAWYVYQATRYADPALRPDFFLPAGYRIAPLFQRIGQLRDTLVGVDGGEARAARVMTENTAQPDDGIYELLVAGAYARRGWDDVRFVPEAPGVAKRNDLMVERPGNSWAVEIKRAGRSGYARDERLAGERMADGVHALSRDAGRSLLLLTRFRGELHTLGDDYLSAKVERFLGSDGIYEWDDEGGEGMVADVGWARLHAVMVEDDIYFGSSRMVELLLGSYEPAVDFTMAGDWTPAEGRPLHAAWVDHLSLVGWRSGSDEAARRKSTHFRGLIGQASLQLPGDRPGAIHVGYEGAGGNNEDGRRHALNRREMATFEPGMTGLRMVYGNYFMPELVTARNESAAVTETLAWHPVGRKPMREPLPGHLLFMDQDGQPGSHL